MLQENQKTYLNSCCQEGIHHKGIEHLHSKRGLGECAKLLCTCARTRPRTRPTLSLAGVFLYSVTKVCTRSPTPDIFAVDQGRSRCLGLRTAARKPAGCQAKKTLQICCNKATVVATSQRIDDSGSSGSFEGESLRAQKAGMNSGKRYVPWFNLEQNYLQTSSGVEGFVFQN
jgi:hypothetical protein